jgi:signal transduction histidine kinase
MAMELDDVSMSGATARLNTPEARETQSDLERASRFALAGELVTAVTHDLRQPLTAIEMNISAASALLRRSSPAIADALAALDDALVQQRQMRDALQTLQDLVIRRAPRREACSVADAVHDAVTLVQGDSLARHIAVNVDVESSVPAVSGDPVLIRQALVNVLIDALEATTLSKRKDVPIRVAVRRAESGVEIGVSHFGVRAAGAGLDDWGLALARTIVAAHGATITLTGTAETGVSVITTWPAHA